MLVSILRTKWLHCGFFFEALFDYFIDRNTDALGRCIPHKSTWDQEQR